MPLLIGNHISKDKTYGDAFIKNGGNITQIFVISPRGSKVIDIDNDPILEFKDQVYVHSNYFTHITFPDAPYLESQLRIIAHRQFKGLVVHLTNKPYEVVRSAAIAAMQLNRSIPNRRPIIFEINPTVKPDKLEPRISSNFDTSAKLMALVDDLVEAGFGHDDFGLCIDTAHLWSYGQNIRFTSSLIEWFEGFRWEWLSLIHLNDSDSKLGGKDVHATIGFGKMWPINQLMRYDYKRFIDHPADKQPSFVWLVRTAAEKSISIILERTVADIDELKGLNELVPS